MAPEGTTLTSEVATLDAAANTASADHHVVGYEADVDIVAEFDAARLSVRLSVGPASVAHGIDLSFAALAESLFAEDWDCPADAAYDDL